MPITDVCCCLCGGTIIDQAEQPSWMAQFRAVYSLETNKEAGAPAYLSGPGRREQLSDIVQAAPSSSAHTTDEDGLVHIGLMCTSFGDSPVLSIYDDPVITMQAWGFAFHSACWEILSHYPQPRLLDVQALMNLCRSFPCMGGLLNWGHDYGGLVHYETVLAPGEEPSLHHSTDSPSRDADPLDIPEIRLAFEQATNYPNSKSDKTLFWVAKTPNADPFTRLPMEILSWILTHLPSGDVVHLKLASRVYANLSLPDSFWKSRFLPGRELDYVFEARKRLSSFKGCWRSIFRSAKALGSSLAVLNRRRIWNLCSSVHGVLEMMKDINCDGDPIRSFFEPHAPSDDRHWITASRALKRPEKPLFIGSRVLHERKLDLPPGSTAIFASTIELFGRRYISGIRIMDRDSRFFSLGYRHANNETLILKRNGLLQIRGFCLAQDQRGVRGLAIISDAGVSDWIGDHSDIPKRKLISSIEPLNAIDSLMGGFDAVKLVSLSIPSMCETKSEPGTVACSQDERLWYPDIPHPALSFLGVSQLRRNADSHQELPICFQVVGCPHDKHSEQPTSVTVRARGSVDRPSEELGDALSVIIGSMSIKGTVQLGLQDVKTDTERVFVIDASQGERITGLDTVYAFGQLLELKIHTSHNRTGNFHLAYYEDVRHDDIEIRSIRSEIKNVVGFWGMVSTLTGFVDIGLVCGT